MSEGGKNRVSCGLTESAERTCFDCVGDLFELSEIVHSSLALSNLGEVFKESLCTDTAGRTLTAGFIADEFHIELGNVNHAVVFVHNDCAAGAHHGALSNESIKIDGGVEVFCCETAAGRTACLDSLELLTAWDAAADVINELSEGGTHGDFNKTYVVYLAAESEHFCTLGLLSAVLSKILSAVTEYVRYASEGLNVVNDGGALPQTLNCRDGAYLSDLRWS